MDFPTAAAISRTIDENYEGLQVAGFRRTNMDNPNESWALDVVDMATGRMETLDEKDDWTGRLERAFPTSARTQS